VSYPQKVWITFPQYPQNKQIDRRAGVARKGKLSTFFIRPGEEQGNVPMKKERKRPVENKEGSAKVDKLHKIVDNYTGMCKSTQVMFCPPPLSTFPVDKLSTATVDSG